ncbi:MFS transporter [candidate division KSB1 bacterium]|nr:MAG: MFS transporter [candidate division KSB1 bacterium]
MQTNNNGERTLFGFRYGYWMLCNIEMFERLAYFLVRSVVAVYIMQADDPGGLHFTAAQKGTIFAWWFVFQSVLPMFTGGYADRYGYKKTIAFSVTMNILGYLMMAYMRTYVGFFAGVLVLATGTAFFKPGLQGSLAQNLTKSNSSVGWGIFYWIVNVGSVIGHALAGILQKGPGWKYIFISSACFTAINYLMLFTFKDFQSGASKTETPLQVLARTMKNIIEPRLVAWLLIMSCFWLMMYQLWDLHPNFLTDWNDSSAIAAMLPDFLSRMTDRGMQVFQQNMLALNSLLIVALMIPVSWAVRRMRTLEAMIIGMLVAMCGIIVAGFTQSGWIFLLGVVFFSLGEMLTGPKKNEYLGLIAPPGKKGLYLGYVNIPVGLGGFAGSKLAGYLYGHFGEKAVLAQKYLLEHTPLGQGKVWDGHPRSLETLLGVPRTEAMQRLQETLNLDAPAATNLLWNTYSPHLYVWIPFAAIGVVAVIALIIFSQMAKKWSDMNA